MTDRSSQLENYIASLGIGNPGLGFFVYGRAVGQRYYSEDAIDSIIASCPKGLPSSIDIRQPAQNGIGLVPFLLNRRTLLRERLEAAAAWYDVSRTWKNKPSPSRMVERLRAIETASRRLLEAISKRDNGNPDDKTSAVDLALLDCVEIPSEHIWDFSNLPPEEQKLAEKYFAHHYVREQLLSVIEGVECLRGWAAEAKAKEAKRVGQSPKRHTENEPMIELIGSLAEIWTEIFQRPIGTSVAHLSMKATGPMIRFIQACLAPLNVTASDEAVRDRIRDFRKRRSKGKSTPVTT